MKSVGKERRQTVGLVLFVWFRLFPLFVFFVMAFCLTSCHSVASTSIDLLQSLRSEIDAYLGITPLPANADRKDTAVEGVIRGVDRDAQAFVLRERPDNLPALACEYSRQIEGTVKEWLGRRVLVSGTLETSRLTRKEKMEAETIAPAASEEETETLPPADDRPQRSPMVGTWMGPASRGKHCP